MTFSGNVLGSGQFGVVHEGFLSQNGGKELVAIKTVTPDVDVETFKALLSEIKIMAYLDRHENIAYLLGACTADIKKRKEKTSNIICLKIPFYNLIVHAFSVECSRSSFCHLGILWKWRFNILVKFALTKLDTNLISRTTC